MTKFEVKMGDYAKVIKLSDRAMHGVRIGDIVKIERRYIGFTGRTICQITPVTSARWSVAYCSEDKLERIEFSEEDCEPAPPCDETTISYVGCTGCNECSEIEYKQRVYLEEELAYKTTLLELKDKTISNLRATVMKYGKVITNIEEQCEQL